MARPRSFDEDRALDELAGFPSGAVPLLLVAYGAATVVGNHVVGRLADRHTVRVLLSGLVLNTIFLAGFALLAHLSVPGSSVGGLVIDGFGLRAPLWLGAGPAVLGVVSLLPELGRRTGARSSAPGRVAPCLASPAGQERP
ncbi:hypothetical protein ACWEJ6_25490 [Nonomuraea sp. NPDC004702]